MINISYGEEKDIKRVLCTIGKWEFYKQYYNIDWIKLPKNLDKNKIKEYSEEEIIESVKSEYLDNSTKIYRNVEKEIEDAWNKISEKIDKVSKETGVVFPEDIEIELTCYGMGGSYWLPNKIILLAIKFNLLATIVHELIYLAIESWIEKYKIDQPKKERIVDLFMSKYFSDIFPERSIDTWSQAVYQKIDYKKVDEIFDKYDPDMELVIKEVSTIFD